MTSPEMVVARGPDPVELVRQGMLAMGGMGLFVNKGAKVVIKPNICVAYGAYENAYTTNPWVVGALVKLCFEAGAASVRVMDFPFNGTAASAYKKSSIEAQVLENGGEMVQMTGYKFIPTAIPLGKEIKKIGVYDEILKADAIINVPIAKHHSLAGLTLAMKNLLGVVDNRGNFHPNFGQRLPDLSTIVKPTLNVVDAVRILMNNGPASGTKDDVKKLDTIIITPDIVAADAYATSFFGKKPEDLKYISRSRPQEKLAAWISKSQNNGDQSWRLKRCSKKPGRRNFHWTWVHSRKLVQGSWPSWRLFCFSSNHARKVGQAIG